MNSSMSNYLNRPTLPSNISIQHGSLKAPAQLNALIYAMMRSSAWLPQLASMPPGTRRLTSTGHSSMDLITRIACLIVRFGMTKIGATVCSVMSTTNANRAAAVPLSLSLTTGACLSWETIALDETQQESIIGKPLIILRRLLSSIMPSCKKRKMERS